MRGFASFSARFLRLFGVELMSVSALVSGLAALAGYLPLLLRIHRRESAALPLALVVQFHGGEVLAWLIMFDLCTNLTYEPGIITDAH